MSPRSFFALARSGGDVRWITRQIVRQPSEARYGRSPVRQVRSTQIRVLASPSSADLFQAFVASIREIDLGLEEGERGLESDELRMRPIAWRVRDLGIVGRGWNVLVDGLLVARWVDLEQVGGRAVEAPATEMTYGLERLALVTSTGRSLARLRAAHCPVEAALVASEEQELSRHLLESLDEAQLMGDLERELGIAERAIVDRLAVPAYEAILRGIARAEVLRARGAFRSLREARAGVRLTELSAGCRALGEIQLAGDLRSPRAPSGLTSEAGSVEANGE